MPVCHSWVFPGVTVVKIHLPVQETNEILGSRLSSGVRMISNILAWKTDMDRGAWWPTICGVSKCRVQLSAHTFAFHVSGEMIGYIISSFYN